MKVRQTKFKFSCILWLTSFEFQSKAPYVPSFFWMQGVEDMVIWVILPEGTTKRDLKVTLHSSEIYVKVGDVEKINGKLW